MRKSKKKKHVKVVLIARTKLNSEENILCKALIDNKISHKEYATFINKAESYHKLLLEW